MADEKTKIEIPKKIADRIQKRVDESEEFKDISEYISYVLEQVVERLDSESGESKEEQVYSEEDEEKVKDRLRALGYLE